MKSKSKKDTKSTVAYNCIHCEKYWKSFSKVFNSMGDEVEFIELYCPLCKRTERGFW